MTQFGTSVALLLRHAICKLRVSRCLTARSGNKFLWNRKDLRNQEKNLRIHDDQNFILETKKRPKEDKRTVNLAWRLYIRTTLKSRARNAYVCVLQGYSIGRTGCARL